MASHRKYPRSRIGARILALRLARGWTQAELGRRTGIARPNVARLETGKYMPTLDVLITVAIALRVRVVDIVSALDDDDCGVEHLTLAPIVEPEVCA